MRAAILEAVSVFVSRVAPDAQPPELVLAPPEREEHGDLALACHPLARILRKAPLAIAEELTGPMAGVLDNAWRSYDGDWIPRSRGADDAMLADAYRELEARGLAGDGVVNQAGIAYRQELEDRLDRMTIPGWQALGADRTRQLIELLEPVSDRFIDRVDATAGANWMPAGRARFWQDGP